MVPNCSNANIHFVTKNWLSTTNNYWLLKLQTSSVNVLYKWNGRLERDRETETERDKDRDRETETEKERDRQRQRQRQRETETERDRDRDRDRERQRQRQTETETETERQRESYVSKHLLAEKAANTTHTLPVILTALYIALNVNLFLHC